MKMNAMNYDIHVGQILGLTGKIIAFITSLICASLLVTGFIVWLGKRKKSKSKKIKARGAQAYPCPACKQLSPDYLSAWNHFTPAGNSGTN